MSETVRRKVYVYRSAHGSWSSYCSLLEIQKKHKEVNGQGLQEQKWYKTGLTPMLDRNSESKHGRNIVKKGIKMGSKRGCEMMINPPYPPPHHPPPSQTNDPPRWCYVVSNLFERVMEFSTSSRISKLSSLFISSIP